MSLNSDFWNQRYQEDNTPWDIGYAAPALINYVEKYCTKSTRILIPGAGKAHEAIHLHQKGYENIFVCDWADNAFDYLRQAASGFPEDHLLTGDFFQLNIEVDLIIEQTFFCAISPTLRQQYVQKTAQLLKEKGKLIGLLFANPFPKEGPPFGGTKEEYQHLFKNSFKILQMEMSKDSIGPRQGNELFIELQKS